MIDYSIVVPCFNESDTLANLVERFSGFMGNDNAELIIVDNGSTDSTSLLKVDLITQYSFVKWVSIEKNIGYGNGILSGLLQASGKIVGYTHADLQTNPEDVKKALELITSFSNGNKSMVKGFRTGRSFIDRFFSKGMEFIVRMILKQPLKEINAQPNVFTSDLLENLKNPPNDWGFDLYLYYTAKKSNFIIKRINVEFPDRRYGYSKWNTGFFSKIKLSYSMIQYCYKLIQQ